MTARSRSTWLVGDQRAEVAMDLARRYVAGASIRELADESTWSFGTVRALLLAAGVALRTRGGKPRENGSNS